MNFNSTFEPTPSPQHPLRSNLDPIVERMRPLHSQMGIYGALWGPSEYVHRPKGYEDHLAHSRICHNKFLQACEVPEATRPYAPITRSNSIHIAKWHQGRTRHATQNRSPTCIILHSPQLITPGPPCFAACDTKIGLFTYKRSPRVAHHIALPPA